MRHLTSETGPKLMSDRSRLPQLWMTDGTEANPLMGFEEPRTSTGHSIGHLTVLGRDTPLDTNRFQINLRLISNLLASAGVSTHNLRKMTGKRTATPRRR